MSSAGSRRIADLLSPFAYTPSEGAPEVPDQAWQQLRATGGLIFGCIALVLFFLNTRLGMGVLPDSVRYMGQSEIPYDAPLYPWLLQAVAIFTPDIETSAKIVGAVLTFLNPLLVWRLLLRTTDSVACTAAGTALIVAAPLFAALHAEVMSEPLYLFMTLLTLLALLRFWADGRYASIAICGLLIGLTGLVRFTAPALGAAIVITLLLDVRSGLGRRLRNVALLVAVGSTVFLAWALASEVATGHSTGRSLAFFGNMDASGWLASLTAITAFMLPGQIPFAARATLLCLVAVGSIGLLFWYWRRALAADRPEPLTSGLLPIVLALHFVLYLAFMVLAMSLEANLRFNPRYAFPVFTTVVLMLTILVAATGGTSNWVRYIRSGFAALALLVFAGNSVRTGAHTIEAFNQGIGFSAVTWTRSPTMLAVARLPESAVIYSNGPDAITHVLHRRALYVPMRVTPRTNRDNPVAPMQLQLEKLQTAMSRGNAYVVFLDGISWRPYLLTEAELRRRTGSMQLVDRQDDGRIYSSGGAGHEAGYNARVAGRGGAVR